MNAAQGVAVVMQPHLMGKPRPRKFSHLQNVVQEFSELERALTHRSHLRSLLDGCHVGADLMDAASGWRNDIVEVGKVSDEQCLSASRLLVTAGIRHWLPTTSLIERIIYRAAEFFEQLERCNPDMRLERIE